MARGAFLIANITLFLSAAAWAQAPGSTAGATPSGTEARLTAPAKAPQVVPPAASTPVSTASAPASNWQDAFPAAAVESYLSPKVRVLVAAAGEDRAVAQAATSALLGALRASDRVQLVMTDAALGSIEGLSDEAIVAKAKGRPVDLVSIVRAFPSSDGLGTAVVTHFILEDGKVAFSWAASPNAPLMTREAAGADAQSVEQVAAAATKDAKAEKLSQAEYDQNFIGYDDFVPYQPHLGNAVRVRQQTTFYLGIYKRDLPLPDLFTLVGRTDLREKYDRAMTIKIVTLVAGVGTMVASVVPMALSYKSPAQPGEVPAGLVSLGLFAGGTVISLVGLAWDPNPIPMHEVRALADGYNRKLRGEAPVSAVSPIDVSFGIAPLDGGAIAGLSGRF